MKTPGVFVGKLGGVMAVAMACTACGGDGGQSATNRPVAGEAARGAVVSAGRKEVVLKEHRSGAWSPGLSDEEQATLFAIAEDTLTWCVKPERGLFSFEAYTLTPKLKEPCATFVTLKIGEHLRGCIGSLTPVEPMYKSIHSNAINAALQDYRFRPVTAAELPRIDVHISLLSPIEPIASLDDFKLGEHGIIISKNGRRAVYLPEVAVEQHWTKEETLSSLSMKAGLPPDAWKEGARFQVFSSVVLSR